jgi:hypothetical protein
VFGCGWFYKGIRGGVEKQVIRNSLYNIESRILEELKVLKVLKEFVLFVLRKNLGLTSDQILIKKNSI